MLRNKMVESIEQIRLLSFSGMLSRRTERLLLLSLRENNGTVADTHKTDAAEAELAWRAPNESCRVTDGCMLMSDL